MPTVLTGLFERWRLGHERIYLAMSLARLRWVVLTHLHSELLQVCCRASPCAIDVLGNEMQLLTVPQLDGPAIATQWRRAWVCAAEQQQFLHFALKKARLLSATMGPQVERVSAARITTSLSWIPQIVVPDFIAVGGLIATCERRRQQWSFAGRNVWLTIEGCKPSRPERQPLNELRALSVLNQQLIHQPVKQGRRSSCNFRSLRG